MDRRVFRNPRPGLVLPPAVYSALSLVLAAAAPGLGWRILFAAALIFCGLWLARSWNSAIVVSAAGVTLRGRFRTRSYAWPQIRGASLVPMATMSPVGVRFPYVNLELRLRPDERLPFPELSARESAPAPVAAAIAEIQRRLAAPPATTR